MIAVADAAALRRLEFADGCGRHGRNRATVSAVGAVHRRTPIIARAALELEEYFAGRRSRFTVPIRAMGTEFEMRCWRALTRIPCGAVRAYAVQAKRLGRPTATRAVAHANARNPLAVIIPCHRLIGSDGRLVGYGGGLWRKDWLLRHERRCTTDVRVEIRPIRGSLVPARARSRSA